MAAINDVEVLQHVSILGVEVGDGTIRVDLYGGDEGACGTVTYRFDDERELAEHARTLRTWWQRDADVTYVRRGDVVLIMDEIAYLAEAFAR